jgi:subtilisin family serine protease
VKRFAPLFLAGLVGLAACSDDEPTGLRMESSETAVPSFNADAEQVMEFVPGQIIVRFRPGAARSEIAEANRASHKQAMRLERTEILEVPVGEELEIARRLARNPNVEFAEPDWIYKVGPCEVANACDLPDGQFFHYKWDLQNTGSINDQALGWGTVSSGTKGADIKWADAYDHLGANFNGSAVIAILDTGIRTTHQAFAGKIIGGRRFVTGSVSNFTDDHGHGTHVAATAAARANAAVPGVAYSPNVRLLIAKVCTSGGSCPSSGTADAIVWAADNGAHVINMSLGSPGWAPDGSGSAAQQAALQYANGKNVISFCATGNDHGKPEYSNTTGGIGYPARFPECVAVGSTNWNDAKASYSNFGPQIEISAPGGDGNPLGHAFSQILAASHSSDTGYRWMAGTSMATPQVAGLAALLHATGTTGREAILERIKSTADDLGAPGWDVQFGAGRINVYRALTGLDTKAPPVAVPGSGYSGSKGVPVQFDGSASHDPNGRPVSFAWSFGDGATGAGAKPTHTYSRAGIYTVTLTVTDASGLTHTETTIASIPNIAPAIAAFPGATLLPGETYTASGSFADADPDTWTATVNYGDGSGGRPLALSGKSFSLSHRYTAAGSHPVTVTVSDDDNGTGSRTATVTVLTPQSGIQALMGQVSRLNLPAVSTTALQAPLQAAVAALDSGNRTAATQQMEAFVLQVDALVRSGRVSAAQGAALAGEANRILASVNR